MVQTSPSLAEARLDVVEQAQLGRLVLTRGDTNRSHAGLNPVRLISQRGVLALQSLDPHRQAPGGTFAVRARRGALYRRSRCVCYRFAFGVSHLFAKWRSSSEAVSKGRQRGRQERLRLDFDGPLDDPSGGKRIDDPGQDPTSGAAEGRRDLGARILHIKVRSKCCMHPTKERLFHLEEAAPWSDIGETWPKLHSLRCRIRRSRSRRLLVAPEGGLVPDRPSFRRRMGCQEGSQEGGGS